jgi:hypothetical protein
MSDNPIAAALAQLQLERDNLAARLEKVDGLIASMRDVFHLPHVPARLNGHTAPSRKAAPKPRATDNGRGLSVDAVRKALKDGPLSPGAIEDALGAPKGSLRYQLGKLVDQGALTATGTTAARRLALADDSAKEAP